VFAAFCDAGLWPGCGPALREKLPAAGVRRPDDVTEPALAAIEGVSAQRASKLVTTFSGLAPTYEVAQLLSGAGLPVRLAAGVATHLAPAPAARLSDDPWRLLDAPEADLAQADRLASHLGVDRGSPTRGPAVIAHLLALAAR
jgi:exodeoxyribonuclease V alpha subunit